MLLECVPNFSEGRDRATIRAIAEAIDSVAAARLLNVDSGAAANRTVMTFAGPPDALVEAAFRGAHAACERIDMRRHQGVHPRMGAMDVCPFIPLRDAGFDDAVRAAETLGRRIGAELGAPVYLYERAARAPERRNLAALRRGGFEALADKLTDPVWAPDFGPAEFRPRIGAFAVGARPLLVAYNVNLAGSSVKTARRIAARVRESGSPAGTDRFRGLKAIGWRIADFDRVQVSMNIVDLEAAPLHEVYERVRRLADEWGDGVAGSELVGMIPQRVLENAGRYYAGATADRLSARALMEAAAKALGLDSVKPFSLEKRVLELALGVETLDLAAGS